MRRIKDQWHNYFDLGLIGSAHGLSDGFSSLLVPVLALIVTDLNLSTIRTGTLLSVFSLATFFFLFPLSITADHSGSKKVILIIGLSIASLAYFGMQWVPGFTLLAVLTFVAGAGNAAYHPCGTALAAERFASRRAIAISFHSLMGNFGASIMPVVQAAVATSFGWRTAIAVCTLPAAIILPLIGMRFPRGDRANVSDGPTLASLRILTTMVLKNRNVVILAIVYALKGMATKTMVGFFPLLASGKFGMKTSLIGTALTLYFFMGVGAKPIMGYLYNRWGARSALFYPLCLSGGVALLVGFIPWAPALIVSLGLAGLIMPISPIILTAAADMSDKEALASSVGFIYTFHGLGFVAPLIGGWLADGFGMSANYIFAAILIWVSGATSLALSRNVRKAAPDKPR